MIRDPETFSALRDSVQLFVRERLIPAQAEGAVTDRAAQTFGGAACLTECGTERFGRDVRLFRIDEGTRQIRPRVIARNRIKAAS